MGNTTYLDMIKKIYNRGKDDKEDRMKIFNAASQLLSLKPIDAEEVIFEDGRGELLAPDAFTVGGYKKALQKYRAAKLGKVKKKKITKEVTFDDVEVLFRDKSPDRPVSTAVKSAKSPLKAAKAERRLVEEQIDTRPEPSVRTDPF